MGCLEDDGQRVKIPPNTAKIAKKRRRYNGQDGQKRKESERIGKFRQEKRSSRDFGFSWRSKRTRAKRRNVLI